MSRYESHLKWCPQWGAADTEIKVPSGENARLKLSPFKAWSRSVYSHTCYAYCQGFLPCLVSPFRSIHLHCFQNLSRFLLSWPWLTQCSCVCPQNKIGHPAGCRFPCWVPAEYKQAKKERKKKRETCGMMTYEMNNLEIEWSKFVFIPDVILCGRLGSKHQLTN